MKTVIIYESIFGNTQRVAEAIAKGLSNQCEVTLVEVGEAGPSTPEGADLLVVGGPCHMWGMSRGLSRMLAKQQVKGEPVSKRWGVRDGLKSVPHADAVPAAAFDTGFRKEGRMPVGSAAGPIASRLRSRGYRLIAPPERFFVAALQGPLLEGELERAAEWGQDLTEIKVTESE